MPPYWCCCCYRCRSLILLLVVVISSSQQQSLTPIPCQVNSLITCPASPGDYVIENCVFHNLVFSSSGFVNSSLLIRSSTIASPLGTTAVVFPVVVSNSTIELRNITMTTVGDGFDCGGSSTPRCELTNFHLDISSSVITITSGIFLKIEDASSKQSSIAGSSHWVNDSSFSVRDTRLISSNQAFMIQHSASNVLVNFTNNVLQADFEFFRIDVHPKFSFHLVIDNCTLTTINTCCASVYFFTPVIGLTVSVRNATFATTNLPMGVAIVASTAIYLPQYSNYTNVVWLVDQVVVQSNVGILSHDARVNNLSMTLSRTTWANIGGVVFINPSSTSGSFILTNTKATIVDCNLTAKYLFGGPSADVDTFLFLELHVVNVIMTVSSFLQTAVTSQSVAIYGSGITATAASGSSPQLFSVLNTQSTTMVLWYGRNALFGWTTMFPASPISVNVTSRGCTTWNSNVLKAANIGAVGTIHFDVPVTKLCSTSSHSLIQEDTESRSLTHTSTVAFGTLTLRWTQPAPLTASHSPALSSITAGRPSRGATQWQTSTTTVSGATPTTTPSVQHLRIPRSTVVAFIPGGVSTVVSAMAVSTLQLPSTTLLVQRSLTSSMLADCDYSLTDPLALSDSPTQFAFGADNGAFLRGAVLGNWFIWVGCAVGSYTYRALRAKCTGRTIQECCDAVELPGILILPAAFLLQSTAQQSVAILVHSGDGDGASDVAMGLASVFSVAFLMSVLGWKLLCTFYSKRSRVHPQQQRRKGGAAAAADGSAGREEPLLLFFSTKAAKVQSAVSFIFEDPMEWHDSSKAHPNFTTRWGQIFDPYADNRHWFALCDLGIAIAVGVVGGVMPDDPAVCDALVWCVLAFNAFYLIAVVVLRPFSVPFDKAVTTICGLLAFLGSCGDAFGVPALSNDAIGGLVYVSLIAVAMYVAHVIVLTRMEERVPALLQVVLIQLEKLFLRRRQRRGQLHWSDTSKYNARGFVDDSRDVVAERKIIEKDDDGRGGGGNQVNMLLFNEEEEEEEGLTFDDRQHLNTPFVVSRRAAGDDTLGSDDIRAPFSSSSPHNVAPLNRVNIVQVSNLLQLLTQVCDTMRHEATPAHHHTGVVTDSTTTHHSPSS